jgi:hypothetical protein
MEKSGSIVWKFNSIISLLGFHLHILIYRRIKQVVTEPCDALDNSVHDFTIFRGNASYPLWKSNPQSIRQVRSVVEEGFPFKYHIVMQCYHLWNIILSNKSLRVNCIHKPYLCPRNTR